jgi:plasmid stabilization system protein ParE
VATLRYSERAIADIRALALFLFESDPDAALSTTELIEDGLQIVRRHPLIGRPAIAGFRELPISRGRTGYVALYEYVEAEDEVRVMAVRHQRESGFRE